MLPRKWCITLQRKFCTGTSGLSGVSGSRWIWCVKCRPRNNALPTLPILTVRTPRIAGSKKTGHLARMTEKRNTYEILVEMISGEGNTRETKEHMKVLNYSANLINRVWIMWKWVSVGSDGNLLWICKPLGSTKVNYLTNWMLMKRSQKIVHNQVLVRSVHN